MKRFYFLLLAVLACGLTYAQTGKPTSSGLHSSIKSSVMTPVPGSGRRACSPIPTKDGIAINPQVKVLPNKNFIRVNRQGYTGGSNFTTAGCNDLIVDGSFENGGIPSTTWPIQTSTNFGTPLCDNATCGTGAGASPPRTGLIWAWFGGVGGAETATLGQTVTILPGNATLTYWMRIGTVTAPFTDVFTVKVDGTVVQTFTEPAVAEAAYTQRTVDLSAYANGAAHSIVFSYVGTTTGTASFVVDDVQLNNCSASNADLAITKTDGATSYNPGGSATYTIVASNPTGPDAITGATVTDNFPAAIISASWTAVYAGGASGPASGTGNISATVNLPIGGTATFTAICNISGTATGSLSNTATIASPSAGTDPNPANNSATDTDTQGAALTCGWTASTVIPIPIMDEPVVSVGANMYTFSGVSNAALVATSYKFNGTTWSTIANLPVAVEFAAAVTDGTNIYIMGGANNAGNAVKTLRRYNVALNTYTNLAAFNTNVWGATAAYLNGKIYKFAGNTNTGVTNVLEIYDIATNTWTAGAVYPLSLGFVNCFVSGNFIYAAGGIDAAATPTLKTYRYDPATNTWNDAAIADLPATRWGGASGLYNGQGLIAGGFVAGADDANISTSAVVWDPTSNAWSTIPSMLAERARMGGAVLNNSFYVVGGASIAEAETFVGTNNNQKYSVANATISYPASPYCSSAGTIPVTQTGTTGGTYSSAAGLSINATTGAITAGTSTAGTYTVTYTIAANGPCPGFVTTAPITITAAPSATISYAGSPYCSNAGTANVTQTGTSGGTYSSTAGLVISASTGAVTLGTSTPGTYTVTYTVAAAGGCALFTTTATITITAPPSATINYAGSPYCQSAGTATVTQTGTAGGVYSSTAGLVISPSTGTVTLGTSTPGTYTVSYTIATGGGCSAVTATASITITATSNATISYPGSPYCPGAGTANVTQTGTTGGTYSSTAGLVISSSTGAVTLGTSTPGTYTVTYTIAAGGGCASFSTTASITISNTTTATISYAGSPYCSNAGTATVTQTGTGGGTYSSTAGLIIDGTTGAVTLATSTAGTYTVTYTIAAAGGCTAFTTTTSITITTAASATINYAGSPYCQSAGTATVTQTGTGGGTYSSTAGLVINAATGAVTLGTSTPGTYTVTYTIAAAGGCATFTTTASITITATPNATISYPGTPYCQSAGTANVTPTGTAGGVYSSTAGLTINAATGAVTLGTSTPGTYTVTYTIAAAGGCAVFTTTASITVTATPNATISYAGSPYCQSAGNATVTQTGTTGGTYSSTAGLIISASTGTVTLGTSTPGIYTVTYTVAAAGGCAAFTTTASITITATPNATISYPGSPYCAGSGTAAVTRTGTGGGTYSSTAGLVINAATGAVTLGTSTPGTYTVTYSIAAAGGCGAFTTTASISIGSLSVAPTGATASPAALCAPATVTLTAVGGTPGAGGVYKWYAGSCGGTPVGTGVTITTTISATTTFYVRIETPCDMTACASVSVNVYPQPVVILSVASGLPGPGQTNPGHPSGLYTTVSPAGNYTYVWTLNGSVIPATGPTITPANGLFTDFGTYAVTATNTATGCFASSNAVTVTDIEGERGQLFITPNPAHSNIDIHYYSSTTGTQARTVSLFTATGQRLMNVAYTPSGTYGNMTLDISMLPKGTYIVVLLDGANKKIASAGLVKL